MKEKKIATKIYFDAGRIEFIRKDKLLELIEKERQVPHVFGQERDSAFRDVIKIINSL